MVETEIDSQNIKKLKNNFFFKFISRITVISENRRSSSVADILKFSSLEPFLGLEWVLMFL
jgi:hypothetical protein